MHELPTSRGMIEASVPRKPKKKRLNTRSKPSEFQGAKPIIKQPEATPAEHRAMVRAAAGLVAFNVPREEAVAKLVEMHAGHGLDQLGALRLLGKAEESLISLAKSPRELEKGRQLARLEGYLTEARKERKWQAVASLEREIAKLRGTYAPTVVLVASEQKVMDSLSRVLAAQGPETLKRLVRGESPPMGAVRQEVDVEGETIE